MVSTYHLIKLLQNTHRRKVARTKQQQNRKIASSTPERVFQTCRVCLQQGTIPIYSGTNSYDCSLSHYLKIMCGVKVSPDDIFPKYLCKTCLDILDVAIKLRKTAKESETKLKELILSYENTSNLNMPDIESEFTDNISTQQKEAPITKPKALTSRQNIVNTKLYIREEILDQESNLESEEILDQESNLESEEILDQKSILEMKPIEKEYEKNYKEVLSQENKPVFECQICKKIYKKCSLADHYITHLPDSPIQFICEVCGKTFKKRCVFYQHLIIHNDDLPFKCNLCPYRGRAKDQLNGHIKRIHDRNKEFNFMCTLCPKQFTNGCTFRRHKRRHSEPKFKCPSCHKLFYDNSALQRHNKDFHTDISAAHKCDLCGSSYRRRKVLLAHQIKVHKRKKMVQGCAIYLKVEKSTDVL